MKFEKLLESIGIEDSGMALNSIQSYLERKLDQKLNRMKWNRVSNKGMNVLFTNTLDAGAIKFNFEIESRDMKYVKKDSMGCTSIDIYSPKKTNGEIGLIEKPTVTMQIPDGVSFKFNQLSQKFVLHLFTTTFTEVVLVQPLSVAVIL